MRNSVCTRCGTSFLHAVDKVEVCPQCERDVFLAALLKIAQTDPPLDAPEREVTPCDLRSIAREALLTMGHSAREEIKKP